jgi:lycopene beta-cyclase
LARRAPVPADGLRARLEARLAARGVRVAEVVGTERVLIPMGVAPPPRHQRAIGFGVAGGLVHPATGYSVAASLRAAPRLAGALARALDRRATPAAVAEAGWDAVWPVARRRARALEDYGLSVLLHLGPEPTRRFFDAFFALPEGAWSGYLSGALSAAEVAGVMGRLYRSVPVGLRARLLAGDPRALADLVR